MGDQDTAVGTVIWTERAGFIAAGQDSFLRSLDGLDWELTAPIPHSDSRIAEVRSMVEGPSKIVAVGDTDNADTGPFRAAVWTSTDGLHWSRAPDSPAFDADRSISAHPSEATTAMEEVVRIPRGFLALGYETACIQGCERPFVGMMWTSSDGSTWQRVPLTHALAAVQVVRVVASGQRYVAYGGFGILASADGIQWSLAKHAPNLATAIGTPSGFVGVVTGSRDTILTSRDGRTWHAVFHLHKPAVETWAGFVSVHGGFVLVGDRYRYGENEGYEPVVVTSRDGMSWSELPADPSFENAHISSIATDGQRVLLLGSVGSQPEGHLAIWMTDALP